MIVSFHSTIFDLDGHVSFNAERGSNFARVARRVSRTATLDGNAVITDMGATSSDETITIQSQSITPAKIETLKYLCQTYPVMNYSDDTGHYQGCIESVDWVIKPLRVTFLVAKTI